jgi:hypothetical protein
MVGRREAAGTVAGAAGRGGGGRRIVAEAISGSVGRRIVAEAISGSVGRRIVAEAISGGRILSVWRQPGLRFFCLIRFVWLRRGVRNPVVVTTRGLGALGCDNHGVGSAAGRPLGPLRRWWRVGLATGIAAEAAAGRVAVCYVGI